MPDENLNQNLPWQEELAEKLTDRYYNQRIAHEAYALDAIARQGKIIERLALKQQDGTIGEPSNPEGWELEPMIHVGDNTYQFGGIPDRGQGARDDMPPMDHKTMGELANGSTAGFLAKIIGVPLLAMALGGGAGLGVPWLFGAFDKTVSSSAPSPDTYTQVEAVQLWHPEAEP